MDEAEEGRQNQGVRHNWHSFVWALCHDSVADSCARLPKPSLRILLYDTPRTRTLAAHYDSAPPTPHAKHLTMPGFSRRRTMISALALAGVAPAFSASAISAPADPANPWDVRHTARRSLLAEDSWFCTYMEKALACGESTACAAADGCAEMFGQCHADYEYTYGTGSTASNWQTDSPRVKCILDRSDCQDDSMSEYTDIMTACEAHTTESACNGGTDCEWDEDIDECVIDLAAHAQHECPILYASVSGATSPRLPGAAVACAAGVVAAATLFA